MTEHAAPPSAARTHVCNYIHLKPVRCKHHGHKQQGSMCPTCGKVWRQKHRKGRGSKEEIVGQGTV